MSFMSSIVAISITFQLSFVVHFYKFFDAVKILKVVVYLVNVPIPPLNTQKGFNNFVAETVLYNLRGVTADNSVGRHGFNYNAVRRNNCAVTNYKRLVGNCLIQVQK